MTLDRRCPHCKGVSLSDVKVSAGRNHGGFLWKIKCCRCRRVLDHWELVDGDDRVIAVVGNVVRWRREPRDRLCLLSGRDAEGMAL